MRLKIIFIIILTFFTLSCLILKAENKYPPTNFKLVKELFDDGFNFKIGKTLDEVKKNLGKPKEIKVEKHLWIEEKTYEAGTFYTLIYDGIEVEIYEIKKNKEQLLTRVKITNNNYLIKHNIKIGTTKDILFNLLGDYRGAGDNYFWYYIYVENEPDLKNKFKDYSQLQLIFSFKDDKINEINFLYESAYTDGGDRVEIE